MCFFLYSPDTDIELEYVLENIYLNTSGSSRIIADVLVNNQSKSKCVDTLYLIYPNFFYETVDLDIRKKEKSKVIKKVADFDITGTYDLLKPKDPGNSHYNIEGRELVNENPNVRKVNDIDLDKPPIVILTEPNPINVLEDAMPHKGYVSENSIDIVHSKDRGLWYPEIYQNTKYTLFMIKLETPIQPRSEYGCWLRLRFKPKKTAITQTVTPLFNNFSFEIVGPETIKNRFKERLICYAQELKKKLGNFVLEPDIPRLIASGLGYEYALYGSTMELIDLLEIGGKVTFKDWRAVMIPSDLEIISFNMFGNIKPMGGTIPDKIKDDICYKVKSGEIYNLEPLDFYMWFNGMDWKEIE